MSANDWIITPVEGWPKEAWPFINRKLDLQALLTREEHGGEVWYHLSVAHHQQKKKLPTWADLVAAKDDLLGREWWAYQVIPPKREHRSLAEVMHVWARPAGARALPDFLANAPKGLI